jgi:hypothetical protein
MELLLRTKNMQSIPEAYIDDLLTARSHLAHQAHTQTNYLGLIRFSLLTPEVPYYVNVGRFY